MAWDHAIAKNGLTAGQASLSPRMDDLLALAMWGVAILLGVAVFCLDASRVPSRQVVYWTVSRSPAS